MGKSQAYSLSPDQAARLKTAQDLRKESRLHEAIQLLVPLAEQGVPQAMALLGSMYFLGEGVPVDGKKAVALLSKAAGMGDGVAAHNLGVLFQRGTPDVPPDRNQSMHFYRLARDLGAQFWPDEFYQ